MAISFSERHALERHDLERNNTDEILTRIVKDKAILDIVNILKDLENLLNQYDACDPEQDLRDVLKAVRKEI